MIKAVFAVTDRGGIRLSVKGHSSHGAAGEDIVCAAVSGIVYGLCGYLGNFCGDMLKKCILEPGYAIVECEGAKGSREAEAMKHTFMGLLQIALSYPDNLAVEERVWGYRLSKM